MTVSDDRERGVSERIRAVIRGFPGHLTVRLFELVGEASIRYVQVVSPTPDQVELVVFTDTAVLVQRVTIRSSNGDRHAQTHVDVWARRDLIAMGLRESQKVENRAETENGELVHSAHPGITLQYLDSQRVELVSDVNNPSGALTAFLPSLVADMRSPRGSTAS